MPELTAPGPVAENAGIREAVCIHTKKIYDSCRDKDHPPYNKYSASLSGRSRLS